MKNIIITGCSKGIGLQLVKTLSTQNYNITMACRNVQQAEEIAQQLNNSNLKVMQLDLEKYTSILNFSQKLQKLNYKCDILFNNAGVFFQKNEKFDEQIQKKTIHTNFYGTCYLTESLLNIMNPNSKILFVGGVVGLYKPILDKDQVTLAELKFLADNFVTKFTEDSKIMQGNWKQQIYGFSKVLVNTLPKAFMNEEIVINNNIQVYSLCPGWTKTDLGGSSAKQTLEQAMATPQYLIDLPYEQVKDLQGKFFMNKKVTPLY